MRCKTHFFKNLSYSIKKQKDQIAYHLSLHKIF